MRPKEPCDRRGADRLPSALLCGAACVSAALVFSIFAFLAAFSWPVLSGGQLGSLLSWHWRPLAGEFGILPMVVGSLCLAGSAMAVAYPLALGVCCFVHGCGPAWAARPLFVSIRFMTSVPTVVYGLVSVFLLVPVIRGAFSGSGFSWLAAALVLAVLVLPTVVLIIDTQFQAVRAEVRVAAAAVGLAPSQEMRHLVLPLSRRGLAIAVVLGFGRALGDTLIPLMLAGNAPRVPGSLLDSLRTLTAHIALVVATDSHSAAYNSLFACGLILFLATLCVNLGVLSVRGRRLG